MTKPPDDLHKIFPKLLELVGKMTDEEKEKSFIKCLIKLLKKEPYDLA